MYNADKNLGIREDLVQQVSNYSPGGLLMHQMLTHFDLYSKLLTG